jgi:polar amino acid transport system substrate-binding protein
MKRKVLIILLLAIAVVGLTASSVTAFTLDDIIKRGKVRILVPIDVSPFGMMGKDGKLEGYDIDVANLVAKDMGVELELIPTTGINRIPYLLTKKVDIVISTLGSNPERAKSISFTAPYMSFKLGIFGGKDLPVTSAKDTAKYKVGVPRGTTQDLNFTEIAPEGCTIIRYEDDATTMSALLSGQVDMIGTTQVVASKLNREHPGKVAFKFILRESPGHFGVRRGEYDLLNYLNTIILYHRMNGDFDKISMKWLGVPVGPVPNM